MEFLLGSIYVILLIGIYFLPSIVAARRKHVNFTAIFILNLFLGFTLFGWVFALIWAVYNSTAVQSGPKKKK
ncbi:MAG: superinfection immunity protein [Alphaproteobacteria bacterium]|nr:superinfection immunity protein [Alphaproteobacteria bacterium]